MNESRLSTGFSWKRGFFASQSKGLYDHKAPPKEQAAKNLKIHSPLVEKRPHTSQRNFPTCEAVRGSTSLAMDTDPASFIPLNATPVTVFTNATGEHHLQHDSRPPPAKRAGTEPHTALKYDDGQIHRASPIRGLPPEYRKLEDQRLALQLQGDLQPQKADKGSHAKPTGVNILDKVNSNADNDDGLTHRAQPVRGLPLKQQGTEGTPDCTHNASASQPVATRQQSCSTKDPGLTPNPYGPRELQTTTISTVTEQTQIVVDPTSSSQPPVATSMTTDQSQLLIEQTPFQQPPVATRSIATGKKPISVELRPPPSPPDANDGPEAVMRAIDAWFDYQDYLESMHMLSQTHSLGTDDGHHPLPVDGKRLPEQQSDTCQRRHSSTKLESQPGGQLDGQRAPRKRFSWNHGFLKAHKPPQRRPIPTSQPQPHNSPKHKGPDNTPSVASAVRTPLTSASDPCIEQQGFLQRYDLCLNLCSLDGRSYSEWEGITNLLVRLQEIDDTIELWPWVVKDHNHHNPPIAITSIADSFFDLQTYVPGLASMNANLRTRLELGDKRHPSIRLRSTIPPLQVVEHLGPWLSTTKQGMWIRQLPFAEQTICIGWLLYSAPEYNLSWLRQQIKHDTGMDVALRFRSICADRSGQEDSSTSRTKAIHLEVDSCTLPSQLKGLEKMYAKEAKTFPLGIKMQLVPTRETGNNQALSTREEHSIRLQARFLQYTETSWIKAGNSEMMTQCPLYNELRDMKLPLSYAQQPRKPLFHAVSPTATNDGYLVRFLPQYRVPAQAAIDRLTHRPMTIQVVVDSTSVPCQDGTIPTPSISSRSSCSMAAIDQWMKSHFCKPFFLGYQPNPQPPVLSVHSILLSPAPSPSHHKLLPWLVALRYIFLNTAWDWWRHRIGVLEQRRDSAPCTAIRHSPAL